MMIVPVCHAQTVRSQPTSARAEALARAPTRNAAARTPLRARPDGRCAETRRFSRYLAMVIGSSSFYFEHMRFSACNSMLHAKPRAGERNQLARMQLQ